MSHHLLVMKDGDVVEQGRADIIFDYPKKDYTKSLMRAAFAVSTHNTALP